MNSNNRSTIKEALTEGTGPDLKPTLNWYALSILVDTERDSRDIQFWDDGYAQDRCPAKTRHRIETLGNIVTNFVAHDFSESTRPDLPNDEVVSIAERFAENVSPPFRPAEREEFISNVLKNIPIALDAIRARREELDFAVAVNDTLNTNLDAALALWSAVSDATKPLDPSE